MTNEEAKFWFITETESEYITPAEHEAYTAAINAIEKQIPKKPTKTVEDSIAGYCPCCGNYVGCTVVLANEREHHCICGQAIDWSESDD